MNVHIDPDLLFVEVCNNETHIKSSVESSLTNFLADRNNQLYVI